MLCENCKAPAYARGFICGGGTSGFLIESTTSKRAWHIYLEVLNTTKTDAEWAFRAAELITDHFSMTHVRILQTQPARADYFPNLFAQSAQTQGRINYSLNTLFAINRFTSTAWRDLPEPT